MTTLRVAMWSGPRNISTAMMRAFGNRADTEVWDEPLYGHYLHKTAIPHPGADEVIAAQGTDWQAIAKRCTGDAPNKSAVFYQKHMTMHLLPEMDKDWLAALNNCFLIRQPDQVVASYGAVRADLTFEDIGFVQQAELFEHVKKHAQQTPVVIDSQAFLHNPQGMLRTLCDRLGIEFTAQMLQWPVGKRDTDGVWGKYWYDNVWQSTGFAPYREKPIKLTTDSQRLANQAKPFYQALYKHRLIV